jgi:hypothetical protein
MLRRGEYPQLPKNRWGGWLGWVNLSTYTMGSKILKKNLKKVLVGMQNMLYLWWVGGFVYRG